MICDIVLPEQIVVVENRGSSREAKRKTKLAAKRLGLGTASDEEEEALIKEAELEAQKEEAGKRGKYWLHTGDYGMGS